jgi:hypothetical protein
MILDLFARRYSAPVRELPLVGLIIRNRLLPGQQKIVSGKLWVE